MDDCLKSVESSAQAVNLAVGLQDLLSRDGFRLLKWFSNRPEVMETIPESERAPSVLDLVLDKERLPVEQTLSLRWDMQKDMFIFDTALKSKPNTRRGIPSLASSIYDPLGFLAPIILPAKKLLKIYASKGWTGMIQLVRMKDEDGKNGKKICQNFLNMPLRGASNLQTLES